MGIVISTYLGISMCATVYSLTCLIEEINKEVKENDISKRNKYLLIFRAIVASLILGIFPMINIVLLYKLLSDTNEFLKHIKISWHVDSVEFSYHGERN